MTDIVETLTERGSRYGTFTGHAEATQTLKAIFRSKMGEKWDRLADDQKESLEMIAHKLGRIINGDPNYADSWVDIAGYAKLVADRLEGIVR
jgi:DNA-binding transcriptional regulator GbsR (MarR family)